MFPITSYLIGHPLIALGLAIFVLLCAVSVLRKQIRTAITLWVLILITFLYVYVQTTASPAPGVPPTEVSGDDTGK